MVTGRDEGGATLQMSMAPLNLTGPDDVADYVVTGSWGKKAVGEATKFCNARVVADASGPVSRYAAIPGADG